MHGYLEQETQPSRAGIVFLSLIVILWGTFTYFAAKFILAIMIDVVIEHPGTQPLAFWDYAEFWMWEIKGIFGMGTGALLITTSLLKRR